MVGCNGYRHPALYAKIASTVDVASHGRLYAGIGAGWYEHEWRAYGFWLPELRDRMGMFERPARSSTACGRRITPDLKEASTIRLTGQSTSPKVSRSRIRRSGSGRRRAVTLRLVAQWADACNVMGDIQTIHHKLDVLKRHCEDVGRDYEEIIKSTGAEIHLIENEANAEQETAQARGDRPYDEYARQTIVGTPEMVRGAAPADDRCGDRLLHHLDSARGL